MICSSVAKLLLTSRRESPKKLATTWIVYGLDQDGLEKKFIDKEIGYGVIAKLDMASSRNWIWRHREIGYGVIATKQFEKGSFILHYTGDLITKKESERRERKYSRCSAKTQFPRCYLINFRHRESS